MTESPVVFLRSLFPNGVEHKAPYSPERPVSPQDQGFDMQAVTAIRNSDVSTLRQLLADGVDFNARNLNGESLLHLACRRGSAETVLFLVKEARVSLNVQDNMGRTVLHDVCWRPRPDMHVMDILLRTVPPQLLLAQDIRGHTPFDYTRQGDWPAWNQYLSMRRPLVEQHIAFTLAVEGILSLATVGDEPMRLAPTRTRLWRASSVTEMETC